MMNTILERAASGAAAPPPVAYVNRYKYDANNNLTHEAWAVQGAVSPSNSDSVWAIRIYTLSGNNVVSAEWAGGTNLDGSPCNTNRWSDYA